jgi:hypothetical protein
MIKSTKNHQENLWMNGNSYPLKAAYPGAKLLNMSKKFVEEQSSVLRAASRGIIKINA